MLKKTMSHRMGPQDSVQLPYKWQTILWFMDVYGRYKELVHGGYNGL